MAFLSGPQSEVAIPGYEVRKQLSRGGMGIVYEALQVKARRPVALKVIRGGEDANPEALRRFRGEADLVEVRGPVDRRERAENPA